MSKESITTEAVHQELPIYPDNDILALQESGERATRSERIDLKRILHEEGITDEKHVEKLARQMKGPRGQLCSILVRVNPTAKGRIEYQIVDGFHRDFAFPLVPIDHPKAEVMYNCDDEEFYDLRITAAQNVQPVKFPRMGEWITKAYGESEWAKKGLTISQLSSLTLMDSSGVRLGLSAEESEKAKLYMQEKADRWGVSAETFCTNMMTIEKSSPDLLRMVRNYGGGSQGKYYLNEYRFKAIVDNLRDKDMQNIAGKIVTSHNLNQKDAALVSMSLNHVNLNEDTIKLFFLSDPVDVAKQILMDNNVDLENIESKKKTRKVVYQSSGTNSYDRKTSGKIIQEENEALKKSLIDMRSRLSANTPESKDGFRWWDTLDDLSAEERIVIEKALGENPDRLENLADDLKIPLNRVIKLFISAHTKFVLKKEEENLAKVAQKIGKG